MKKALVLLIVVPTLGVSYAGEEDFFYFHDIHDEALFHIAREQKGEFDPFAGSEEMTDSEEFDQQMLTIFESELNLQEDLPWEEEMSAEEITAYVERKARRLTPDYDDVFSYDAPAFGETKTYAPTSERVPEGNRHFFGRPRVVHTKPDATKKDNLMKKNDKRPIKRPPIADKKPKQPKTVAKSDG